MYVLLHCPRLGLETRRLVRLSFIVVLFAVQETYRQDLVHLPCYYVRHGLR